MKALAAILGFTALVGSASAEVGPSVPLDKFEMITLSHIRDQQIAIHDVRELQTKACSKPMSNEQRALCNAAYNMIISRRYDTIAWHQLRLASIKVGGIAQHVVVKEIAPSQPLDDLNKATNAAWELVYRLFPATSDKQLYLTPNRELSDPR